MPPNFARSYQQSDHGLTVTARLLPGEDRRTYVRLAGEMDIASSPLLLRTVDWLTASAPASVLVDLADLTFACSTLPNFVARVRHAVPDDAELVLWRATPATTCLLRTTDMATIATISHEPTHPLAVLV